MVEVTQADRDAAELIRLAFVRDIVAAGASVSNIASLADENEIVQAFARHRIAAENAIVDYLKSVAAKRSDHLKIATIERHEHTQKKGQAHD